MTQTHTSNENEAMILFHLHRYANLFSEFDAREMTERTFSADFLEELHHQVDARDEPVAGITFVMPHSKRNENDEATIKTRIVAYFRRHIRQVQKARRFAILKSALMLISGAVLMTLVTYISSLEASKHFPFTAIRSLIEPASWFLMWEGMNHYTSRMNELKLDLNLYEKILKEHDNIRFVSEEHQ